MVRATLNFLQIFILYSAVSAAMAEFAVLTERVLEMSHQAAILSAIAYLNADEFAVLDDAGNIVGHQHPSYEEISFYTEEPDQAVLAKKDGRCYVAFRGTVSSSLSDWLQNINLEQETVHQDGNETLPSCQVRAGYADFLTRSVTGQAYQDLLACVATTCTNENDNDDCLVMTGHSQGGASAAVSSISTYSLRPTVITFGMPPAMQPNCDVIPSERLYRYVNSIQEEEGDVEVDIAFDPVPFVPTFFSGSVHYGHYVLLGPDETAVKYLGFNQNYTFAPDATDQVNVAAHDMYLASHSYEARVTNLLENAPVSADGFADGVVCEPQYSELCASGVCQGNVCVHASNKTDPSSGGVVNSLAGGGWIMRMAASILMLAGCMM